MMNDAGDLREDLKLPDGEMGVQIKTDFENGRELLVSCWAERIFKDFILILSFNYSVLFWKPVVRNLLLLLR